MVENSAPFRRKLASLAVLYPLGGLPASGTIVSAVAFAFWTGFSLAAGQIFMLLGFVLISFLLCVAINEYCGQNPLTEDPREVVADEFIGSGAAILFLPLNIASVCIAFCLFRFFDILKPPPIRSLERFQGVYGIVLDDIASAIAANLFTRGILLLYESL